jgi:hypothetical protein
MAATPVPEIMVAATAAPANRTVTVLRTLIDLLVITLLGLLWG